MMLSRRRLLIATALLAATPALAAAPAVQTPEDVVKAIYTFSAGKSGKWDGPSALFDKAARKRFFSKAFIAAFDEEDKIPKDGVGALDFDPISNSQDPSVHNLVITAKEVTDKSATVEAAFTYEEKPDSDKSLVTYIMVNETGWKVDDIKIEFKGEEGKPSEIFSVRGAFAGAIKDYKDEQAKKKGKKP